MTLAPQVTLPVDQALIVDDHPIVHDALGRMLQSAGVRMVHGARGAAGGLRDYLQFRPDLVIVDLAMDDDLAAGETLIRNVRSQDDLTDIVVFSMCAQPATRARAMRLGADGFIAKHSAPSEILEALRDVSTGRGARDGQGVEARDPFGPRRDFADFTAKESEALSLLGKGRTYKQISGELGVSYKAVAETCAMLKYKLNAGSLQELVRIAVTMLFVG